MPKINRAQLLYLQNNFKGGVSVDGKSYPSQDYSFADTINFHNAVPAGSTIKKAFLISRRIVFPLNQYPDEPLQLLFNNNIISIDSTNIITPEFYCDPSHTNGGVWMAVKDVTSLTLFNGNKLIIPCQGCIPNSKYFYVGFLFVILYENAAMAATNVAVIINNKSENNNMNYFFSGLNAMNTANDVGLSVWVDNAWSTDKIGFTLNSSLGNYFLGSLWGGPNGPPPHDGELTLPGSFYYQNNTLFGLVDDINSPFIDSTDAIANIKTYVLNNTTTFSLTATLLTNPACYNAVNVFILAYTTPCPARSIVPAQTYTLCSGQSLQLQGNGGNGSTYTWYPGGSLNDSTIATPLATPTVSTNYIALIDSMGCKHTEHFSVGVYQSPQKDTLDVAAATCGDAQGAVSISNVQGGLPTYSYSIGGAAQTGNYFNTILPGTYTATVIDANGCTLKKPFVITEVNPAVATFSFTPNVACVNEPVGFINTSGGTNLYWWHFFNNDTSNAQNPSYIFTDTGTYNITLIAWHNQRQCSDTITHTVYVKECPPDSFTITAPNIFTPNGDDINETWQPIIFNSGFTINNYSLTIFDRWGLKVFESTAIENTWDGHTTSGTPCSEGTYYYILNCKATNTKAESKQINLKGFLQLSR